jgi:hypothetical protein
MPDQWFANIGQIIQIIISVAAIVVAVILRTGFPNAPSWLAPALAAVGVGAVAFLGLRAVADAPPWLAPALAGVGLGAAAFLGLQGIGSAKRLTSKNIDAIEDVIARKIEFIRSEFRADDSDKITYKRKLFIIFQNNNDVAITVGPQTRWRTIQLPVDTVTDHAWSVEVSGGKWTADARIVQVEAGRLFRTWVGLPDTAKKEEVEKIDRYQRGELSTSIVIAKRNPVDFKI